MLIILGGLPGTGKTTIAKQLAKHLKVLYLRVDTVEQVLKRLHPTSKAIGPDGYLVCYDIAADNLRLGQTVIADSVNPIAVTRHDWRLVAKNNNVKFIEVECICSDVNTHKSRVETREADITGHNLPSWQDVLNREYEPWDTKMLSLDTSKYSVDESVKMILECIKSI